MPTELLKVMSMICGDFTDKPTARGRHLMSHDDAKVPLSAGEATDFNTLLRCFEKSSGRQAVPLSRR
jgi:hypothetical protein